MDNDLTIDEKINTRFFNLSMNTDNKKVHNRCILIRLNKKRNDSKKELKYYYSRTSNIHIFKKCYRFD